jgi:hypothetical protein
MTMLGNFGVRWCELVRGTGALTRLYASLCADLHRSLACKQRAMACELALKVGFFPSGS